jgi:predicted peptidase
MNLFALAGALLLASSAPASSIEKTGTFGGQPVAYKVVLPEHYDAAREYPAILAFGGGHQGMSTVDDVLERFLGAEAQRRGFIVIAPAAPASQIFFEGGSVVFPEFLDMIRRDYKIQGGRMHVAGGSNGGTSAFFVAALYPEYFWSVTGFPGLLQRPALTRIQNLRGMCIQMLVGGDDTWWLENDKRQVQSFRSLGIDTVFRVIPNQPHRIDLDAAGIGQLFDRLEASEKGCAK